MKAAQKTRTAVLVPLYKTSLTEAEEFSLERTLAVLAKHDVYIIGPKRLLANLLLRSASGGGAGVKVFEDSYFSSIAGYNRLLKSVGFYKAFDQYEYILIAQTDALIISDCLDDWCDRGYSYVGAPWFNGFGVPSQPLTFFGVGNGGLSLRKVSHCLRALSRPTYLPNTIVQDTARNPTQLGRIVQVVKDQMIWAYNFGPLTPRVNEDLFWGILIARKFDFFVVPTPEEAARFAFEVAPEFLYALIGRELPFGCHAWERYSPHFWRTVLKEIGVNLPRPDSLP